MSQIIYSGEKFREFLSRRGITYVEASKLLGIDKNTIGKAVRGGNLNMNVLLTICNHFHLHISDFFVLENPDGSRSSLRESDTCLSADKQGELPSPIVAAEESFEYSVTKKKDFHYDDYIATKDQEISLLREMIDLYKQQILTLQEQLLKKAD